MDPVNPFLDAANSNGATSYKHTLAPVGLVGEMRYICDITTKKKNKGKTDTGERK